MIGQRQVEEKSGLYGRLLHRLDVALHQADTPGANHAASTVLELQGLSDAELSLIRAYLGQDLQWLRGWQAAAQEMELIRRSAAAPDHPGSPSLRGAKRRFVRHPQLLCALCGVVSVWAANRAIVCCPSCGSRLFRAAGPR